MVGILYFFLGGKRLFSGTFAASFTECNLLIFGEIKLDANCMIIWMEFALQNALFGLVK